jgi:hypothetical protein
LTLQKSKPFKGRMPDYMHWFGLFGSSFEVKCIQYRSLNFIEVQRLIRLKSIEGANLKGKMGNIED